METSDAYQKLVAKALEKANKETASLEYEMGELSLRVSSLTEEEKMMMKEAQSIDSKAQKYYIANFHLIGIPKFCNILVEYAFIVVVEWIEVNYQTFDTSKFRSKFLEEREMRSQKLLQRVAM